jgi:hypothetical protein
MTEKKLTEINWTAAFVGFGVDLAFSVLVGSVVITAMLGLEGASPDSGDAVPSNVELAFQAIGVLGAGVGGVVAGYLARRRGSLHGVIGSTIGLILSFCAVLFFGGPAFGIGDLGFTVLNLVAAGYGGALGERWRARR